MGLTHWRYSWVKTANGQAYADLVGVPEPPMTLEESATGVLAQVLSLLRIGFALETFMAMISRQYLTRVFFQIDTATKTTTSGSFLRWDGRIVLW
jgi:norsolorinic acid ketoreductase